MQAVSVISPTGVAHLVWACFGLMGRKMLLQGAAVRIIYKYP